MLNAMPVASCDAVARRLQHAAGFQLGSFFSSALTPLSLSTISANWA